MPDPGGPPSPPLGGGSPPPPFELEADDGQALPTADDIEEAARFVASLGLLNDLDGEPLPDGSPAFDDGEDPGVRVAKMREALRVFLADGIKLTPATDAEGRFYFIDLAVLPLSAAKFQGDKRRTAQRGAEPYDNRGCAGAQLDVPAQQFQGVTEVWVPFEEAIVIGWRKLATTGYGARRVRHQAPKEAAVHRLPHWRRIMPDHGGQAYRAGTLWL